MAPSFLGSLSVLLSLASSAVFLLVAKTVWDRPVSQESERARNAFVIWWAILGFITLAGLILQLPSFPASVAAYLAVTIVLIALLCVGLWGLLFYLIFLFTNRRDVALPLAMGYVLYFAFLVAFILANNPTSIKQTELGPQLEYANEIDSGPIYWAVILLLILPPIAAAAGYLSLYWKVDQQVQKRRILLVSVSILVWFGSSLVGTGAGAGESVTWSIVSRLISLAAAITIYYAYRGLKPSAPEAATTTPRRGDEAPIYQEPPRKGVSRVAPQLA
jgi:hypothetical protein